MRGRRGRQGHRGRRVRAAGVLAAVLVVAGCGAPGSFADLAAAGTGVVETDVVEAGVAAPSSPDGHAAAPAAGNASAALAGLQVKGRAPKTGYARDEFGRRWADIDRDGCDQRNQVLARDMDRETFKAGTRDCVVLTGSLRDSYTATTISFTRGQGTSDKVQIDHVVALSDAWQKGAQQLDEATRERIGNDPLNLVAVDGPTNGRKGDGDAATWLPPDRGYRCAYVARQVAVKTKYRLWVTAAERDAIDRVLRTCPDRSVPTEADAAKPAVSLR
ncbi:lipoprotein [Pseudonocardia sp. EC080610-09]|nr:lipoprotein [Pseudonocardia sp. EC080610-09]ALL83152.1 lipoprotein [Pseudonocardia sp. EC080619-01]